MSAALPLALAALIPAMIGPLPTEGGAAITARLCNGGTITIPLGDDAPAPEGDCHPKGCHAGTCRPKDAPKRPNRAN
jgi:hypothetical protein